jgi:TP901 family phage tail tape measure protein
MAQSFNLTAKINLQGPYNLRPIISKIKKDIGSIKPELKFKLDPSAAKSVSKVTAEIKKLDSAAKSAKKSVGSLNSSLQTLSASFNTAAASSRNAANSTAAVTKATNAAAKSANQARTAVEEFGKQSGLAIKRFAAFTSVTTVIYGLTNAVMDAYKEFLAFNKEVVRLSQVTDKSLSDLSNITNEITRLSTTIGVASSDLIVVASTLAQAGLSAEDTKIALEALAKSSLAPSFENITDTTEGAIAAIRQFGLQTSQLESALGSINAVAAAFAVESGDIIAAIQRTGGVFASASRGVSEGTDALNEFIAIFTSIRQTTRESAETIATGLRTIFTRIQRSSTIELLKQYGVELRDLEGKFVGPYEAVRRLSEGLNRIDPRSADFARISEELGGFRQIGKVIPLIQQFSVAQDALNVAQKGSGSLTRDVITAQQSLAVQFAKTRENFLALVREIGDSSSFQVFVNSTLFLTNAFIDLGRILKPLLPLLLTFSAIKIGSSISQFSSGFGLAFNRGGGGGAGGVGGAPGPSGGTGGGGPGNQPLTSALALNTTANNTLNTTIATLNSSILALNQNIVNTNSLLLNRPARGFATGGLVPGSGNTDSVRANLTPGEFVLRKRAVEAIGIDNLAKMNSGGFVRKYQGGSPSGVESLSDKEQIGKILQEIFGSKFKGTYIEGPSGNVTVRSLKTSGLPKQTGGLPIDDLQLAQNKINKVLVSTSVAKTQKQDEINKKKQDLIDSGKVFKFGLAGLRFGTSAQDKWSGELPPSFVGLESVRETDKGIPVQIFAGALSNSAKIQQQEAQALEQLISRDFSNSVQNIAQTLGSKAKASVVSDPAEISKRLQNAGISNVIGAALEGAISLLGAPYVEKDEKTKSIDFPSGLGSAADIFGIRSDIPTDVTRTIGSPGKGITDYLKQIGRFFDSPLASMAKYATGGGVSSEDTVPALLTPGEFVFSRESAQRIGYGTLNRMNKVKGFNKGGSVGPQRFAVGGGVFSDPAAIVAALSGILLPQVQRLAESFGNLEGSVGQFGTAIGGAIREASSLTLSAGLGLRAVGASDRRVAFGQALGGIGGAIGGGVTDTTAKALEKALLENSKSINKFSKNLEDITNAPTEELRLEAASKLQQSFNELDFSIRSTKDNVDRLENLNIFGKTVSDITLTLLTSITAITALTNASNQAAATVAASRAAGAFVTGAAAVSVGTRLLAGLSGLINPLGLLLTTVSVGISIYSAWNSRLKSSTEQFDRLNKALDETVKNSKDYSLSNRNFIENILPKFNRIVAESRGQNNPQEFIRERLARDRFSNLDLRFRTRAIAPLAAAGIPVGENQGLQDIADELRRTGANDLLATFERIVSETEKLAMREDAISYLVEKAGMNRQQAEAEYNRMASAGLQETLNSYSKSFAAAKNQEVLAARSIVYAQNQVQVSLVNLDNILNKVTGSYNKSLSSLSVSFDNINRQASILRGEPQLDRTGSINRDVEIFKNLAASSNKEVVDALTRFQNLTQFPTDIGDDLSRQIRASKVLEEQATVLLNTISAAGGVDDLSGTVDKILRPALEATVGTSTENKSVVNAVLADVAASLERSLQGSNAPKTLKELGGSSKLLGEVFQSGEKSVQFVINSLETYGKFLSSIADEQKKLIDLENQAKQSAIQRIQLEKQSSIKLKELFDVEVPLSERLDVFDSQIRELTRGAGGGFGANVPSISPRGTTDVGAIIATRQALREEISKLDIEGATGQLDAQESAKRLEAIKQIGFLNQAIKLLAESSDKANETFEAIAKQRDLFKTQREILIDFLKGSLDPTVQLQQERDLSNLEALLSGTAGFRTTLEALDSTLLKAFPPNAQERIISDALQRLGPMSGPTSAREASMINGVLIWLQGGGFETALAQTLTGIFSQTREAQNAERNDLKNEIDLRQEGIVASFTKFKTDFDVAAILAVESVQNLASRLRTPALSDTGVVSGQSLKALENIFNRLSSIQTLRDRYLAPGGPGGMSSMGPAIEPLFDTNQIRTLSSEAAKILSAGGTISDVTQLIRNRVEELGELNVSEIGLEKYRLDIGNFLNVFLRNIEVEASKRQRTPPTPQGGGGRAGATIPSASLNGDSLRAINSLATAITGENSNISSLASAVKSLEPVANSLKTAVETLASRIGPEGVIKINQTSSGNVNVTFDTPLTVENTGNLDNKVLGELQSTIQDKLYDTLNSWGNRKNIV